MEIWKWGKKIHLSMDIWLLWVFPSCGLEISFGKFHEISSFIKYWFWEQSSTKKSIQLKWSHQLCIHTHTQTHFYMLIVWKFNSTTTTNKENNKQKQSKYKWCTSKNFASGFIVFHFTSRMFCIVCWLFSGASHTVQLYII